MPGREEQISRGRDKPESRQQHAREAGTETKPRGDERPASERQAEAELLKTSGGDPLTQEG